MKPGIPTADVCVVLEGTYPYVRGGVSSWVHNLISGLPDTTFALLLISANRRQQNEIKYEIPPNVLSFAEVFVHESVFDKRWFVSPSRRRTAWEVVKRFHYARGNERRARADRLLRSLADADQRALTVHEVFTSRMGWEFVAKRYGERAGGTSFIDYFWTWRAVHAPLFQTLIAETPPARLYHAVSTGYAGLAGVVGKMRTGNPLLLTEHGLYVRERAIDIARADWIHEEPVRVRLARPGGNPLKEMWINFFATLGQITYDAADEVIALFGGNMDLQVQLGADPQRTRVIPNGVDVESYAPLRGRRAPAGSRPLRVGFVGRVVPIKDVKTLIKACALVARKMPSVEYWIVGPTDEDETYSAECRELVATLGLSKLKFTGMQDVKNIYPEIDVMVLTSISEGQPLTVLEAACAGVPTVATDVGACRELIEGRLAEDRALGPGGRVTGVGAPEQTASAVLEILGSDELREQMAKSGVTRTEKFYRQSQVLSRYSELYKRHLST